MRPGLAQSGLHVALGANGHGFLAADLVEVHRRVVWLFLIRFARRHGRSVPGRRAVAHLAIDAGFAELYRLGLEPAALHVTELTGVAGRAINLIAHRSVEPLPGSRVRPLAPRHVDDLPKVDPAVL